MSWITENPWPLILILAGTALVLLIVGESKCRGFAVGCAVAAAGLYFLEGFVVTPTEDVEQNLESMLQGFVSRDQTAIDRLIAAESPGLKEKARQGLELAQLDDDFHMKDITVTVHESGKSAEAHLRANGSLIVRQNNTPYHAATRWRTKWVLQDAIWKLSEVHRLDVVTGEEIGILDAQ